MSGFSEGEIYELNGVSKPLYIWHYGTLHEVTPQEFNVCVTKLPKDRWIEILKIRFTDQIG